MKLGARILKTGLAIMLSLYLAIWFNIESPTFAALAAAFAVQPSIYRTFQTILEQVQANVIGAILGIFFVITFGQQPYVVGLVVALAIAIILKVKLEATTIPLAMVTVIVVMGSPVDNFIEFASWRFVLIIIGVLAAFIVNLVFIPPRYETKLYQKLVKATEDINQWTMLTIRLDADHRALKKDLIRIEDNFIQIDNLYLLFKEERNYFLKNKYSKARKEVLYRQMLATTKKAFSVLRGLARRSEELSQMPEDTHQRFELQLDHLTAHHERSLLRYVGKVHSHRAEEIAESMDQGNELLMDYFIRLREQSIISHEQWLSILPIVSEMVEYQEELEHLNDLISSFFKHHKDENDVNMNKLEDE
ncbi:aromatic acid exporter family protein [bacterium LRH843]|nr:aromatic acid exporter family protein [bacterium LRH843]